MKKTTSANALRKGAALLGAPEVEHAGPRWRTPTFSEFLEQVEHEFGQSVDTSTLFLTGIARGEHLRPADVRALCAELGIPAEDFGV